MKANKLFLAIVSFAVLLRFIFPSVPPSLNWDEISHGFNAYSILKTDADEWGVRFPTIFRAYGDYKLPVYIYLTTVAESILGLSTLAVRLTSILAGIGIVIFTFLLGTKLFNRRVGMLAGLLAAVEPWTFFLSRGAFEANLGAFFIISGAYFFLRGLEKKWFLPVALSLFGLSVWTYNSARIFVPLFLVVLFLVYHKELRSLSKKLITCYLLLVTFFFLPMFYQLARPAGLARYGWVAILDEGAINNINESRRVSKFSPLVTKLVYNKATYFSKEFAANYLNHFSPDFLYIKGGSQYQFSTPGFGLLYPVNALFFLIGLILIVKKKNMFLLSWLLLSPVASSLTRESPHVLRAVTMLPIPMLLSAYGATSTLDWLVKTKNRVLSAHTIKLLAVFSYFILLFFFAEKYLFNYFFRYPYEYSQAWQYGYDSAVDIAKIHYKEYDQIIVTKKYGEPHEFFLYYWPWDPAKYKNDTNLVRYNQTDWFWVDRFDKFYFVNDWEIPKDNLSWKTERDLPIIVENKKTLLITSPNNFPGTGWERIRRIYFKDGSPAFDILKSI